MATGTLTPPPPRRSYDGEGSAVSVKWVLGLSTAALVMLGGYAIDLRTRLEQQPVTSVAELRKDFEALKKIADDRAREYAVDRAQLQAQLDAVRAAQEREHRLMVRVAKRMGIEVAE